MALFLHIFYYLLQEPLAQTSMTQSVKVALLSNSEWHNRNSAMCAYNLWLVGLTNMHAIFRQIIFKLAVTLSLIILITSQVSWVRSLVHLGQNSLLQSAVVLLGFSQDLSLSYWDTPVWMCNLLCAQHVLSPWVMPTPQTRSRAYFSGPSPPHQPNFRTLKKLIMGSHFTFRKTGMDVLKAKRRRDPFLFHPALL